MAEPAGLCAVSRYGQGPLLLIFWNSSDVLHDRRLANSQAVAPDAYYHSWAYVADKYRPHDDTTAKCCTHLLLLDNNRKHTKIKKEAIFLLWSLTFDTT